MRIEKQALNPFGWKKEDEVVHPWRARPEPRCANMHARCEGWKADKSGERLGRELVDIPVGAFPFRTIRYDAG